VGSYLELPFPIQKGRNKRNETKPAIRSMVGMALKSGDRLPNGKQAIAPGATGVQLAITSFVLVASTLISIGISF